MADIVVGMTTIPERLAAGMTASAVQALLAQEPPVKAVVVTIPTTTLKGRVYDEEAVAKLQALDPTRVVVRHTCPDSSKVIVDEGPLTKLTGLLNALDESPQLSVGTRWLALADDDVAHWSDVLRALRGAVGDDGQDLEAPAADDPARTATEEKQAVGFAARFVPRRNGAGVADTLEFTGIFHLTGATGVPFLETFGGVLYNRTAMGDVGELRAFAARLRKVEPELVWVDDIVIGAWLSHRGVTRYLLPPPHWGHGATTHWAQGTPQLSSDNLASRNLRMYRALEAAGYFGDTRDAHVPLTSRINFVAPLVFGLALLAIVSLIVFVAWRWWPKSATQLPSSAFLAHDMGIEYGGAGALH